MMDGETIFKIFCSALAAILILVVVCVVFFSTPRDYYLESRSLYAVTAYRVMQDVRFREDRCVFAHYDHNETIRVYNMLEED